MSRAHAAVARLLAGGQARSSSTGWWRANCPECLARTGKSDRKACLAINVRSGVFKCWKCQLSGRLQGYAPMEETADAGPVEEVEPPPGFAYLAGDDSLSLAPAREYLRRRVPERHWLAAGLGATVSGPYAGRLIVPVLAEDDVTWVGWVGRTWFASDRAYTYPKGMDRAAALYNGRVLHRETDRPVLVVEGVFDALHLWPDAVAVLGKASEEQMEALAASRRPVVVALDGDAWQEGWAMAQRLRLAGQRAGSVRLPPLADPDEVDRAWLDEEVRRALP